jgi:carbon monoxide dehydrogenase subunit G
VIDAPIEPVWDALRLIEEWPSWWPGVERVTKVEHGDEDGVGGIYEQLWRSKVPYAVAFTTHVTRVERPHLIEARAEGKLEGVGTFRLFAADNSTAVTYDWAVRTTPVWMNVVAPVARPVFAWNHHAVMKNGGVGLARALGATLVVQASG